MAYDQEWYPVTSSYTGGKWWIEHDHDSVHVKASLVWALDQLQTPAPAPAPPPPNHKLIVAIGRPGSGTRPQTVTLAQLTAMLEGLGDIELVAGITCVPNEPSGSTSS